MMKAILRSHGSLAVRLLVVSGAIMHCSAQQQQDPMTMNGGSCLAMAGKECVALAVDKRFGSGGGSLISVAPRVVLRDDNYMVAFTGLSGDIHSLRVELKAQVASKYSRGLGFGTPKEISVAAVASLTSHILYSRKQSPYYVEPLVVGLEPCGWCNDDTSSTETRSRDSNPNHVVSSAKHRRMRFSPYLCSYDMIGAKSESDAFICAGAATQSMFGIAEALWKPDMDQRELLEITKQAFLSALERDCFSGYGATIYLISPDGITEYDALGRSD